MVLFKEGGKALGNAFVRTLSDTFFGDRMSESEAEMILDISSNSDNEALQSVFFRMYQANSKDNDGSPYLQSKILAAYNLLVQSKDGSHITRM